MGLYGQETAEEERSRVNAWFRDHYTIEAGGQLALSATVQLEFDTDVEEPTE